MTGLQTILWQVASGSGHRRSSTPWSAGAGKVAVLVQTPGGGLPASTKCDHDAAGVRRGTVANSRRDRSAARSSARTDIARSRDQRASGERRRAGQHVREERHPAHPAFARRQAKRFEADWQRAVTSAARLGESDLPPLHIPGEGPPHPRIWSTKNPEAAGRLTRAREALAARAASLPYRPRTC